MMGGAHIWKKGQTKEQALSNLEAELRQAAVPGVSMVYDKQVYETEDGKYIAYAYVKSPKALELEDVV